jgi:hypothetical protein
VAVLFFHVLKQVELGREVALLGRVQDGGQLGGVRPRWVGLQLALQMAQLEVCGVFTLARSMGWPSAPRIMLFAMSAPRFVFLHWAHANSAPARSRLARLQGPGCSKPGHCMSTG